MQEPQRRTQPHSRWEKLASAPALASLASVAGAATLLYGVHGRSAQLFGRSVHRGKGKRCSIALTFDDGPNPGTLHLLDYLASQGIRATFFQCGQNVKRYPAIARAVQAAGHEIGNHTFSHPRLCPRLGRQLDLRSSQFIYEQLATTQRVLLDETGVVPTFFRAPYGMRWFGLATAQRQLNLTGVMWTVIGNDWKLPPDKIATRVLRQVRPAGIICLHDGRDIQPDPDLSTMLTAVRRIVPVLKDRGYAFESVTDLLRSDAEAHVTSQGFNGLTSRLLGSLPAGPRLTSEKVFTHATGVAEHLRQPPQKR